MSSSNQEMQEQEIIQVRKQMCSCSIFLSTFTAGRGCDTQLVPFDILTDEEKKKDREMSQALLKFLQVNGYRLQR